MVNYQVAIPSYRRLDVLEKKTLKTLSEGGVPKSRITIFLYDNHDFKDYSQKLKGYKIVKTGIEDLAKRLNYISEYYPEGEHIVICEDDVRGLQKLNKVNKLDDLKDIDKFFKEAFNKLILNECYLWGLSPSDNPYFMKHEETLDFKFIIGVLFGYINRKTKDLEVDISYRQDFQRSILYWIKDKKILRFNGVTFKTTYRAKGGLGKLAEGRVKKERDASEQLIKLYPTYVRYNKRRNKNGGSEVQLIKPRKTK